MRLLWEKSKKLRPNLKDFQNPFKVFYHLDRIQQLKETGDTRPVHITLGLTNYCNHRCSWCYINWYQAGRASQRSGTGDSSRKAISANWTIVEAVGAATEMGLKAVTIVGDGEPTLHNRFHEILEQLKAYGLDIGLFTNFSTNKPENIEAIANSCFFVRGSIDAATPEIHLKSHGTDDFELVVSNLKNMVNRRGDKLYPIIGIQFVANHNNFQEIYDAAKLFKSLGIDYMTIKPAYKNELNVAHEDNALELDHCFEQMRKAELQSDQKFKVYAKYSQFKEVLQYKTNDSRYYERCYATPLSPYIDEDGSVEMCGNLKGRGFKLGNVNEQSMRKIWSSVHRQECMSRIDLNKCPSGCKLDPLNKILWDVFHPREEHMHPNFI